MAAKIPGLKLTKNEVSQTIDLKELFGKNFTGSTALKNAIAQDAIDMIIERTKSGKSVYGGNLKSPYSEAYADSLEFKSFGKSKTQVNMTLTGNMLGTMDVLDDSGNKIKIGWNDGEESAKSYNHNVGDTVPKRPFFGLNSSDLNRLRDKYKDVVKNENEGLQSEFDQVRSAILQRLNKNIFGVDNNG